MSTQSSSPLCARDLAEIERPNTTGRIPVVFIHGRWFLPISWERWAAGEAGAHPEGVRRHRPCPLPQGVHHTGAQWEA
ncbi:hypothetical protein [Streptomyces sp. NPDC002328]|uniref:hypothetical protein n=1 Tax=Streptomyces sp. NPDC002328 TaxID=3364642 RepID=UPI0036752BB5